MKTADLAKSDWDGFVGSHAGVNFLQSWQWGELHQKLGFRVIRRGVYESSQLVGVWQGIVKDAKRGRYLEVPGGPLMDWTNEQLVNRALDEMRVLAREYSCAFVRLRPQVEENAEVLQILQQNNAKSAPMHLHAEHTNIIDLTPSEDTLLANMRRQTRYEVRQVAKRDLEITSSSPTATEIDEFYDLQTKTAKQHNFVQSPRKFLHALRESFGSELRLYRASRDGQLLNLALVLSWGEEVDYFEAASTAEARKEPGAYGVVWKVMRDAKKAGRTRINLWGIAYSDDPNHRYAGVTTFKRGFGGRDVVYTHAHDLVIKSVRYSLNFLIETIRRKKRGL